MITTDEIIKVLQEHNRKMFHVAIEQNKDCQSFWNELTSAIYYLIPSDDNNTDQKIDKTMKSFSEVDSLEVVNKHGKILKRFGRYYKEQNGVKLDDAILGVIGDKLQYYLQGELDSFYADFTNIIDWDDGMFGKNGSCWWGTYGESRDVFIDNGGWGIRFYENESDEQGIGRTWLLPRDNMLVCFNSYGISRPNVSKTIKALFAQHNIKLHYKVAEVRNSCNSDIPYINGGTGFILFPDGINPDEIPDNYDVDMNTDDYREERETCEHCGTHFNFDNEGAIVGDYPYCDYCLNDLFSTCDACGEYCDKNDVHKVRDESTRFEYLCEYCAKQKGFVMCYECEQYTESYNLDDDGDVYCEHCTESELTFCESCDGYYHETHNHDDESEQDDTVSTLDTSGLIESVETIQNRWADE